MSTKTIRLIRKSGTIIIRKQGTELDIIELSTCCITDRVDRHGDYVDIYTVA